MRRRLLILALVFGPLAFLLLSAATGEGSRTALTFLVLLVVPFGVGEATALLGLPRIVGYLVAGVILGPSALGAVGAAEVVQLRPISELAIALIAFQAGVELRWSDVRSGGVALARIMTGELVVTFVALAGAVWVLQDALPFLRDATPAVVLATALLFAAIGAVNSPAIAMAILSETGARGPVARTTLGVVLLADIAVVLLFSAALAIARVLVPTAGAAATSTAMLVWYLAGAMLVGGALGAAVALWLRASRRGVAPLAALAILGGMALARAAGVELLLTLVAAGFVAGNLSRRDIELRRVLGRFAAPIFMLFFALAGAGIDLAQVLPLLPLVLPLAAIRAGAIWTGTALGVRWAGTDPATGRLVWMGLVSQAGLAIGLVAVVAEGHAGVGANLANLVLPLVAVNEVMGPILFRRALVRSGEVKPAGAQARPAVQLEETLEPTPAVASNG